MPERITLEPFTLKIEAAKPGEQWPYIGYIFLTEEALALRQDMRERAVGALDAASQGVSAHEYGLDIRRSSASVKAYRKEAFGALGVKRLEPATMLGCAYELFEPLIVQRHLIQPLNRPQLGELLLASQGMEVGAPHEVINKRDIPTSMRQRKEVYTALNKVETMPQAIRVASELDIIRYVWPESVNRTEYLGAIARSAGSDRLAA